MTIEYNQGDHHHLSNHHAIICFPFALLDKEVKKFLIEHDCFQTYYGVHSNSTYLFIHLDNGDLVSIPFEEL
jgi:hypothetical protein